MFPGAQNKRFGMSTSLIFNARAKPSEKIVANTFDVGLARRHIAEGRPAASVRSSPPRGNGEGQDAEVRPSPVSPLSASQAILAYLM